MEPCRIVPLVLAAGASSRMGRPKASLPLDAPGGRTTALGRILDLARAAGLAPAVVVTGAHPDAAREAVRDAPGALRVQNPRWAEGRTTSIQAGLRALEECAPSAFQLWPVDVCLVSGAMLTALLEAARARPDALAWVPSHADRRGHPLLVAWAAAPRFLALPPDRPAREVVRALAAEGALEHVLVDDPTVLVDLDTPDDVARWSGWLSRG